MGELSASVRTDPLAQLDATAQAALVARGELRARDLVEAACARIEALDALLDLGGVLDKRTDAYSTGMKQKIVVARAVLHDPPVLFFDEATSGLDVMARRAVLDFCRAYPGEERAVVYSTHVMGEVEELCDRVAVLFRGRVVADDTVAGLTAAAGAPDLERAFFELVRRSGLADDAAVAAGVAA
ncbi:MAG: ATP-binding cassette domain-containing protein [Trueperaceae bacterium]|nr:ATP-binding cassette domain-containing protein [Trueperaceae bacterium]